MPLMTNGSDSLFPPPPEMTTVYEELNVPLPEALHLAKLMF
jgi:hypothetical protein